MSSIEHPSNQTELAGEWKSATLATDGSVRNHGQDNKTSETAIGYRLEATSGDVLAEESIYLGTNDNLHNCEAEALAVLAGLYAAQEHNITAVYLHTDSKTVVDHITGHNTVHSNSLTTVLRPIQSILDDFIHTNIKHTERTDVLIETVHDLAHEAPPDTN